MCENMEEETVMKMTCLISLSIKYTLWRDLDSARSKLEVALRFFNGDASKQTVTITFRIPVNTIYSFMPEDFTAITTALHEYVKERFYRLLISNM